MEKWSPTLRTGFKLTWVQVWGIPLQARDLKYIRRILVTMGDMVDVDDDTEAKRRLGRARVLIKTPWRPIINHTVDVHISGESFKVFVVEESGGGSHDCRRRRCSLSGSSEEIVSNDSSLGHLTRRSSNSRNHRDDRWTIPTKLGGTNDQDRGGTSVPDSRNDDVDDVHQTILLPSSSRVCSYPLGNGVSQHSTTSTRQIIPEIAGQTQRLHTPLTCEPHREW